MKRLLWLLLSFLVLQSACERDDLCLHKRVTPVVLRFRDDATGAPRRVDSLTVTYDTLTLVPLAPADSVAFYLPPEPGEHQLAFTWKNGSLRQTDTLVFSYRPREEFLSKACGFILVLDSLDIRPLTRHWIRRAEVLVPVVKEDTLAHANIYF